MRYEGDGREGLHRRLAGCLRAGLTAAAVCMTLMVAPAYGAVQREQVTGIKLTVSCDPKPEAGNEIGAVTVAQMDERISITDPAVYYNTRDSVWIRGEIPVIRLELSVKDTSKYRFTSAARVSVSGCQSEIRSKRVLDGGDSLRVEIKLKKVTGPIEDVADYFWEGMTAQWSDNGDADRYEVRLYRGSSLVTTITTSRNQFDFYPYMSRAGEYSFKVRGISSLDNQKGKWSDKSEESSITVSDVYTGAPPQGGGSGSGRAGWQQDNRGWTYRRGDKSLVRNSWVFADNNWFHLADSCYMDTGWIFTDNNWFYLNPVSDGTRGATRTGYQNINGCRYYLDPASGALWVNRQVPGGSWADGDGVLH